MSRAKLCYFFLYWAVLSIAIHIVFIAKTLIVPPNELDDLPSKHPDWFLILHAIFGGLLCTASIVDAIANRSGMRRAAWLILAQIGAAIYWKKELSLELKQKNEDGSSY